MRTAAELLWAHLIRSVEPDCLVVTSLIYTLDSAVVSCMSDRAAAPDLEACTAMIVYDLIPWLRPDVYLTDPVSLRFYTDKLVGMKVAGLLLAISESSRQEAIGHLGVDPSRVVAISSAANDGFAPAPEDDALAEVRHDPRSTLGITRPFIMYSPSGIDPRKNNEGLIEAFAHLPPDLRDRHQLVITSRFRPADHERLRLHAHKVGLRGDELVLTGYVSDADLIALYRTTELFVYPSIHEGFGLPVLEAMSCGAPVIGSDRTSVPEIIGRDDALFDPTSIPAITQAMAAALGDDAFLDDLRKHGLVQSRNFSWERTAERALAAMTTAFESTSPVQARDDESLLRELLTTIPAGQPALLRRVAQAVAESLPRPDRERQLVVDLTEADELGETTDLGPATGAQVVTVDGRPRLVHRGDAIALVDLHPGDQLLVARAENLADPALLPVYREAQARGARIAVPLASSPALVDALALLNSVDVGIFCADDRVYRAARRAAEGAAVPVHRVTGRDVRKATLKALRTD
jgi:glycosyltransferase involved in cell wall biosynthesis